MRFEMHDARVIVRPSGTEPKLKCYLQVVVPVDDGEIPAARAAAEEQMGLLKADLAGLLGLN